MPGTVITTTNAKGQNFVSGTGAVILDAIVVLQAGVKIENYQTSKFATTWTESDISGKNININARNGVDIGNYITKPARVKILKTDKEKNVSRLEIAIHEGKNRQVRKMCEAVGHKVIALHRSKIAGISVKTLELGKWRYLKKEEVWEIGDVSNRLTL